MEEPASSSDASSTVLSRQDPDPDPNIDLLPTPANEITEDLTTTSTNVSPSESDEESIAPVEVGGERDVVKPRPYQLEMLEESLTRNVIVAMDTGSGKTHIAVLRILHELERMPSHQFIWFLAPTVSLCAQQFEYLQSQITSVQMKYLSGADGVDRWTDENLWNAVLQNVKVVVSTYQILLDALTHSFVKMESLALIVFDEAHNCVGKQAGAKLMQTCYNRQKFKGGAVPHILGLTASPLMRSDPASLNVIEETLDAICRTPKKYRSELRLQVKLPVFSQVYFEGPSSDVILTGYTRSIKSLGAVLANLKIREDPYVQALIEENSERSKRSLEKVLVNYKTWTHDQIKTLYNTSLRMCAELGAWAADHYIAEVVANSAKLVEGNNDGLSGLWDVGQSERQYLAQALSKVEITRTDSAIPAYMPLVSDKVTKLVQTLANESADFRGIVFVQERATAEVLARLLRIHPQTRDVFNVGTMVGTSANTHRTRNIADVVDIDSQKHVLGRFRIGELNLVVATSVLEEGIDVPACNVVLCFQKPANLKSFVQRRGRARQKESKLILFLELSKDDQKLTEFQQLEEMMKRIYEDDMRTLSELIALEDEEEEGNRTFRVASTGAFLELDNAISHLHHFCATLPAKEYVDLRPEFICSSEGNLVRAKVILPLSVDESVRTTEGLAAWKSEKNAIKDAAFEAYVALYKAGLVNDNLLPLLRHDTEADNLMASVMEKRASIVDAADQLNPWIGISKAWKESPVFRQGSIKVGDIDMSFLLPINPPSVAPFSLYWDSQTEIIVAPSSGTILGSPDAFSKAMVNTHAMLQSGFGRRFAIQQKLHVMLFSPMVDVDLQSLSGQTLMKGDKHSLAYLGKARLVQDTLDANISYVYKGYLPSKPAITTVQNPYIGYGNSPHDEPYLSIKRLPRRNDFLHKVIPAGPASRKEHSAVLPLSRCLIDNMPFHYTRFALLLPSILHRFSIYLLAEQLSATILKKVQISNLDLVVTAICASSAQESTNYQRLEFLGDSILKLCTSIQLMAEYPLWHEGLLSFKKDRFVSNGRLAKAAIEAGIDKFIITKQFTGNKWRPLYVDDLANQSSNSTRKISSKILADVVEALIGAATLDGGIPKALACLAVLLPELTWKPLATRQSFLFQRAPDLLLPPILEPLEELLGYTFTKKSLLVEALTHASYISSTSGSLERLEYLGDAILDNIIVTEMYPHNLSHMQMHLLRTAMVNADFLAWICLESSVAHETTHITPSLTTETTTERWPLWRFLRHTSHSLSRAQQLTSRHHKALRDEINETIAKGTHYPWALLARLDAMKFFSDVVESLLGAVWIDSHSRSYSSSSTPGAETSFDTVKQVLENLGVLPYMRRILAENVHMLHPKEELGMLADTLSVKYVIENRKKTGDDGSGMEYICTVFVGEEEVVKVEGGVSKVEVKTMGAQEAVRILKARKEEEDRVEEMDVVEKDDEDGDGDVGGGDMIIDG